MSTFVIAVPVQYGTSFLLICCRLKHENGEDVGPRAAKQQLGGPAAPAAATAHHTAAAVSQPPASVPQPSPGSTTSGYGMRPPMREGATPPEIGKPWRFETQIKANDQC